MLIGMASMRVYVQHNLLDVLSHCHWAATP